VSRGLRAAGSEEGEAWLRARFSGAEVP